MAGMLRQAVVLALLGGAGFGGYVAFQNYAANATGANGAGGRRAMPAPVVAVATAEQATIERTVSAVGSGRAVRSVSLQMLAGGRVEYLGFTGGETVEAGQVLVRLNDDVARAALSEAEADLAEADAALQRAVALRQQGRVAEAALDSAQADRSRMAARAQRAATDIENRTLVSPFEGIIGFTDIGVGSSIGTDTVVATLDDIAELVIEFRVPERFFGDVRDGAVVRAESQIFPGEVFSGVVTGVGRRLDLVTRTFEVRARIDNQDQRLPAGAFLRVQLVFDDREGVMLPEEAIVTQADRSHVFVVADGRAERREVTLGVRRFGEVEVIDGVAAGEDVIVRGVQKVRDGQEVRLHGAPPQGAPRGAPTS